MESSEYNMRKKNFEMGTELNSSRANCWQQNITLNFKVQSSLITCACWLPRKTKMKTENDFQNYNHLLQQTSNFLSIHQLVQRHLALETIKIISQSQFLAFQVLVQSELTRSQVVTLLLSKLETSSTSHFDLLKSGFGNFDLVIQSTGLTSVWILIWVGGQLGMRSQCHNHFW